LQQGSGVTEGILRAALLVLSVAERFGSRIKSWRLVKPTNLSTLSR
jgi:hypothetical protein